MAIVICSRLAAMSVADTEPAMPVRSYIRTLKNMGYLVIVFLLALAIALMAYESFHPRRMRNSMDTTSIDMRRADDGRGVGTAPEDPSATSMWPPSC